MLKVNKLTSVDSSSFSLYRAWRSASIASNLLFISLISFSSLRILSPSPKRTNRMSSLSKISNTDSKWRYLLPVVSASTFTLEASSDNWSKSLRGFHVSSVVNKSISSSGTRSWSLLQKQNDNTVNLLWQSYWRIVGLIKRSLHSTRLFLMATDFHSCLTYLWWLRVVNVGCNHVKSWGMTRRLLVS